MTHVNLNDQELFEIIMALHAFEKTGAVSPVNETEARELHELTRRRRALLDKLHDVFDQSAMMPRRAPMRASPAAESSVPYRAASRSARG